MGSDGQEGAQPDGGAKLADLVIAALDALVQGRSVVSPELLAEHADDAQSTRVLHSLLRLSDELSARERAYDEAIGELQTTLTDLQSQHEELLRTRELAQQLSTPVIRLAPGVLMMPLVGQLDRDRANLVLERLLEATKAERARHVILDITGIGHVDAGALGYFERVARALRLIGAVTILAGVRPQVARDLALQEGGEQPLRAVSHVQEAIALSMASKVRVPSGPALPLGIGSGSGRR